MRIWMDVIVTATDEHSRYWPPPVTVKEGEKLQSRIISLVLVWKGCFDWSSALKGSSCTWRRMKELWEPGRCLNTAEEAVTDDASSEVHLLQSRRWSVTKLSCCYSAPCTHRCLLQEGFTLSWSSPFWPQSSITGHCIHYSTIHYSTIQYTTAEVGRMTKTPTWCDLEHQLGVRCWIFSYRQMFPSFL